MRRTSSVGWLFFAVFSLATLVGVVLPVGRAQVPGKKGPPPMPPPFKAPPGPTKGKAKLPDPEVVSFDTKDGVSIKATYFPGTNKKETVPIILIHGFGGQRHEFNALAMQLQALGHAALAPDLRGHGQSTSRKLPDGSSVTLNAEKFSRRDLEEMVLDIEQCKKFLQERNNKEELNLDMLTIVGAEFGGIVGVRWAAANLAEPDLGFYTVGRNVKAVVLLTPVASFKAVTMRDALQFPPVQSQLSMMLVAGAKDSKGTTEAKKINDTLQRHHPKLPEDPEERKKVQELYLVQPEIALAGTKLLGDGVGVGERSIREVIGMFIDRRLVQRKENFPWRQINVPGQ